MLRTLVPVERELRHDDGQVFLSRVLPYRTVEDVIAGVVLSFVDITDRRRVEEDLRTSEAWLSGQKAAFQAAVKGAPLGTSLGILMRTAVAQIDHGIRCVVYVSDPAKTHLRQVAGMPEGYVGCMDGFKIAADSLACGLVMHTGEPIITPDVAEDPAWQSWLPLAERHHFRACWSFPIETEGKVVGTLAMYFPEPREATERDHEFATVLTRAAAIIISHHQEAEERTRAEAALRESEAKLRTALQEAEAASQSKDHFLAVLSHELRTPLMPITMALGILDRRPDVPDAIRETHAMIRRNVELEARFINDMLDVTRIARGKMEIVREPMDLHEAVRRAVEVSTPDFEAKGQRLTVTMDSPECRLSGDLARLQQVFWNLLKNASKFTPEGGAITICSYCPPGEHHRVEVMDTGIGMEAEAVERIFRPFEQANVSITREFGGLGLGLAIAKATVEAHGGTLRASSPGPGQGATFTVSLPTA